MTRIGRRQAVLVAVAVLMAALGARATAQAVNVTGDWVFNVVTDLGSGTPAITFKQDGEALTGTYAGTLGNATFKGTIKGTALEFTFQVDAQGQTIDVNYKGVVDKDTVKGTVTMAGGQVNGTFDGKRK
jgi:hypothetical protein